MAFMGSTIGVLHSLVAFPDSLSISFQLLAGVQELTAITSHLPGKFEFVYAPKVQAGLMASLHMRNSGHVNHVSARLPGIFTRTQR